MPKGTKPMSNLAALGEKAKQEAMKEAILRALKKHKGNVSAAAEELGATRQDLWKYARTARLVETYEDWVALVDDYRPNESRKK